MTEVLKKGRGSKHPIFYGGGFPEAHPESYQMRSNAYQVVADEVPCEEVFDAAYQVVAGEGLRLGVLRSFTSRAKEIEALNTKSYFPAGTMLENVSSSQRSGGWQNYDALQPHSTLRNYIVHHAPWDASGWLTHWAGRIGPKETPEHFELSPLSERRATGKVRKYYEPASFLFVEDDEVNIEDTEH